jgi:hypothetical protein
MVCFLTRVFTIATAAVNLFTLSHPSIDLVDIDIYRLQRTQTHPYPSVTCYVLCIKDGDRVHRKSREPATLPWPRCVIVALRDNWNTVRGLHVDILKVDQTSRLYK